MRVAVVVRSELEARAAAALAGHPSVETVGMIGRHPSPAWRGRIVEAEGAAGFPIVVGVDSEEAADQGAVAVVPAAGRRDHGVVTHAGLDGLTRALAVRLGGSGHAGPGELLVRTVATRPAPARRARASNVAFPSPLGLLAVDGSSDAIALAPVEGPWAGVSAEVGGRRLVVVDDRRFLLAACLAAGAFVAEEVGAGRPTPVWERADVYLAALAQLGVPPAAPIG